MNKKKKKNKFFSVLFKILSVILGFVLVMIPVLIAVVMYLNSPLQSSLPFVFSESDAIKLSDDGSYMIDVRKGETSQSVGMRLERTGLIRNRYFWNLICRLDSEHIKTGVYKIEMPMTQLAIYKILISGKEILYKVTIPEGVTLKKMAAIIEDAGICKAPDFILAARDPQIINQFNIPGDSMEGYLFPDTYLFPKEHPADRTVKIMAQNFFKNLEIIEGSIKKMSPAEINNIVIIASIVEREYRIAEEAKLMAGVFYNRLRIGMALQSCATVEYIITEIQGKPHPSVLLFTDLEIVNPYNTYIRPGLPPGPISAPGRVALNAAFFPERTEYLYFRLENVASGKHYFSRTHDEHIRAGQLITKPSWP